MGQRLDIRSTLQSEVDNFVAIIGYRRQLTVSAPYYPYDDPDRKEKYPDYDKPGCYVYADGTGKVKYVGKANRYLGNRIWPHIGRCRMPGETGEVFPCSKPWVKDHQPDIAVWTIAVPDEHWWLAAALEGFLTERLLPNKSRQI